MTELDRIAAETERLAQKQDAAWLDHVSRGNDFEDAIGLAIIRPQPASWWVAVAYWAGLAGMIGAGVAFAVWQWGL